MKRILKMSFLLFTSITIFTQPASACTGFGVITDSGTLIGKNRDYYYVPQKFGLVMPLQKFNHWQDNPYHHNNKFYAVSSAESISMGVNEHGLSAVEEDKLSSKPLKDAKAYKAHQQEEGMPDGLVLYAILQNFNTVDEMIPYLSKIFSAAAPDFYQFADAKKILTVEASPGKKYTYEILTKKNYYFAHTNTYLSPEFISLNDSVANQDSLNSSKNRLQRITNLISNSTVRNIDTASHWLMDTYSDVSSKNNQNGCLNTSLFRSDLKEFRSVDKQTPNDKIFGTVASIIISNNGDFKNSHLYLMMFDSITIQSDGKQLIKYSELNTSFEKLFSGADPNFVKREFVRNSPVNGVCR